MRALAAAIRGSVITVKRAYLDLESEGVIVTRHGKGSFVADSGRGSAASELQRGKLEAHLREAAEIARQLGVTDDELEVRLRSALRAGSTS